MDEQKWWKLVSTCVARAKLEYNRLLDDQLFISTMIGCLYVSLEKNMLDYALQFARRKVINSFLNIFSGTICYVQSCIRKLIYDFFYCLISRNKMTCVARTSLLVCAMWSPARCQPRALSLSPAAICLEGRERCGRGGLEPCFRC